MRNVERRFMDQANRQKVVFVPHIPHIVELRIDESRRVIATATPPRSSLIPRSEYAATHPPEAIIEPDWSNSHQLVVLVRLQCICATTQR
jgi:hypothetical protein